MRMIGDRKVEGEMMSVVTLVKVQDAKMLVKETSNELMLMKDTSLSSKRKNKEK